MIKYVWYFADVNKFAVVDANTNWYWSWYCKQVPHAIRLGEL